MKKTSILLLSLFVGVAVATADNTVSVSSALIPQGKTGAFCIELANTDAFASSMEFHLTLPEGITFESVSLSERFTDNPTVGKNIAGQDVTITTLSSTNDAIGGNSGPLLFINVTADEELTIGTKLTASMTKMELAKKVGDKHEKYNPEAFDFDIEITDKVILNENIGIPSATESNVDIRATRTIKAGNWSSVCFPFAMSADKLKAAFGDDYDLQEFTGYEAEKEGDKVVGLTLNFTKNTKAAKINTPYIIKTSQDISEFDVNAKVNPGNPKKSIVVEDDETGEEVETASMTGTYAAGTLVPKNSLFLSGNKFYYSAGKTRMKAFRAYFTLSDVLDDVSQAAARVRFSIDDKTTGIQSVNHDAKQANQFYDLQGRRVAKPTKGLYVKDGRKVIISSATSGDAFLSTK